MSEGNEPVKNPESKKNVAAARKASEAAADQAMIAGFFAAHPAFVAAVAADDGSVLVQMSDDDADYTSLDRVNLIPVRFEIVAAD